jgi:molybdopterin-guanine dinucleotide biosynthesis protein A
MFTIIIQAGGKSKRMGKDKALLDFLGEPLILRVINRVKAIADEVIVTTNHPEKFWFLDIKLVPDIIPHRGALGGLYTALSAAKHATAAIIACDMPFINPNLLIAEREFLIQKTADLVVPETENGMEPLHAIYRRDRCLQPILEAIKADRWRVDSWYEQVNLAPFPLDEIQKVDPNLLSFRNINTPQELQDAIRLAKEIQNKEKLS